ncbi:MAG: GNAT family N-acetyltransferase [Deltaproteobacteria bacterium]
MKYESIENAAKLFELQWDTEFFGVTCAKAVLYKPLTQAQWDTIKKRFTEYQFVSIENRNSEPINAQFIGSDTTAFLIDINIQFQKKLESACDIPDSVQIHQALERDEKILEIAEFPFSKFVEDSELNKRGGEDVYKQWLINSFGKRDKFYAVAKDNDGVIEGFLLHAYSDKVCTIELIAVARSEVRGGIGSRLFKTIEYEAYKRGCDEIRVGTQVRNIRAINFYHKIGCKQVGCHQTYHLWNL